MRSGPERACRNCLLDGCSKLILRLNQILHETFGAILLLVETLMDRLARTAESKVNFISVFIIVLSLSACLTLEEPLDRAEALKRTTTEITVSLANIDQFKTDAIPIFKNRLQIEGERLIWTDDSLRLILDTAQDHPLETYQVRNKRGRWIDLVRSLDNGSGCEKIVFSSTRFQKKPEIPAFQTLKILASPEGPPALLLRHESQSFILEKKIYRSEEAGVITFSIRLEPRSPISVHSIESIYSFSPATSQNPPDFAWTPCLRPDEGDVIADHSFRSPAVILQKDANVCSMIPDLAFLKGHERKPSALDLDCTFEKHPRFSYGLCPWTPRGNVYYCRDFEEKLDFHEKKLEYGFHLQLQTDEPNKMGFRNTVRLLWNLYGKADNSDLKTFEKKPLRAWENDFFEKKITKSYFPADAAAPSSGLFKSYRVHDADPKTLHDAWFNAWYQSIRTAYGVFLSGSRRGDDDLVEMSHAVVDLILSAPQREGLFPTIFILSEASQTQEWRLDSDWAGYPDCYHALDCAWTGYWLLRFAEKDKTYKRKILYFLEPFAEYLMQKQLSTGAIPSFFDSKTLEARDDLIGRYPAETAGSALFLAKYYAVTKNREALASSCRAMTFMAQHVIPTHRWFDFENFLSSSRKPFDFHDNYTLQFPQSSLCMIFSCHAFLELWRSTGDKRFEQWGCMVLDYLSLYQQVWSPPFFSRNLFGGFGVQNTDSDWSDARGALVSVLFFDYFKETGKEEYLERGSAALQSAIAVSPYLSWGRFGDDRPSGSKTCVHWGTDTSITSTAILRNEFGDLFIDLNRNVSHSFDGYAVRKLKIQKYAISFEVDPSRTAGPHSPVLIKFLNCRHGAYSLCINGIDKGTFSTAELFNGIIFEFPD